jgi:predicted NUDIX family phosphoesterase
MHYLNVANNNPSLRTTCEQARKTSPVPAASALEISILDRLICTHMEENVLVVPASSIAQHLASSFDPASAQAIIDVANKTRLFRPRSQVEQDESVKQIIPYVCIRCGDSYVLLQRTKKQSEARLHNKFSLGIGGHINDLEHSSPDLVDAGLQRELAEEISLTSGYKLTPLGIIYDSTTPVGRVHLGVVYELEACDQNFTLGEPDLMSARWVGSAELAAYRDRMETWSQILFDHHIARTALC